MTLELLIHTGGVRYRGELPKYITDIRNSIVHLNGLTKVDGETIAIFPVQAYSPINPNMGIVRVSRTPAGYVISLEKIVGVEDKRRISGSVDPLIYEHFSEALGVAVDYSINNIFPSRSVDLEMIREVAAQDYIISRNVKRTPMGIYLNRLNKNEKRTLSYIIRNVILREGTFGAFSLYWILKH